MYKNIYLIVILFSLLNNNLIYSQKQILYSETRNLSNFNQIVLGANENLSLLKYHNISPNNFVLFIRQGDIYSITITGIRNEVKMINPKVVSNILYIGFSRDDVILINGIIIRVVVPDLKKVLVWNGGKAVSDGAFYSEDITLEILNNAMIMMNIEGKRIRAIYTGKIRGSIDLIVNTELLETIIQGNKGWINLSGYANNHIINVTGDGIINATNLITLTNIIYVTGDCYCVLYVSNYIDTLVTGGCQLNYYGNPTINRRKSWDRTIFKKRI